MDKYEKFQDSIEQAVEEFKKIDKNEYIRIISHLDADGLCAASIIIKALNEENMKYSTSVVPQLDEKMINALSKENYKHYFFTDLGSGQYHLIKERMKGKKVFILDHHDLDVEESRKDIKDVVHVNPHFFDIDGDKEISGSGVVYLFAEKLNKKNRDMAHIAIVGANGDVQENKGFLKLNNDILEIAKKTGKIKVKTGLRLFGSQTKPLYRMLVYSSDINIPGVTGSESSAIQFLQSVGINPKIGKRWKMIYELTDDEMRKLTTAIIMKRIGEEDAEDILGYDYIIQDEVEGKPFRDAREFATLLNACGRLDKASIGIGACLGDKKAKQKAMQVLDDYKRKIINAINWYNENKSSDFIFRDKNFIIINAEDNIPATMIGTLASIISKSNEYKEGTLILSLAQAMDSTTKASLRIVGGNSNIDLRIIINEIITKTGGQSGGHQRAAGAIIPKDKEIDFIEAAKEVLSKNVLEEEVA